jgi:acylglycerol lipase
MVSVITVSPASRVPLLHLASPSPCYPVSSNCSHLPLIGNAYYDLFDNLASTYSIAVHSFDQRGWGRSVQSPHQKGLTGSTTTVLVDIRAFCNSLTSARGDSDSNEPPLFLMGHSMGGAEALQFMLTEPSRTLAKGLPIGTIRGLLLESPFIALHPDSQPNGFTVWAGKLAARIAPSRQMLQKLDSTYMSRDPQVRKDWEEDKLCHDMGTLEGLVGMLQRAAELTTLGEGKKVEGLKLDPGCPVWLGHGSEDRVTSFDASKRLFEKLGVKDKTFKSYEGAYHKLHAEPEGVKDEFVKDVGEWILAHIPREAGRTGVKAKL